MKSPALIAHAMAHNPTIPVPSSPSDPTPEVRKWYVNPRGFIVDATGAIITRMEGSEDKPRDSALVAAAPELLALLKDGAFQFSRLSGANLEAYARTFSTLAEKLVKQATQF